MFRSNDALVSDKYKSGKLQVLWQVVLGCLLSCCMALIVGVLVAPGEAYAADGPAVGTKFTVPVSQSYVTNTSYNEGSGTLTFMVTKQSKGSGIGEAMIVDGKGYVAKSDSSILTLYKVKEATTGSWHNYYVTGVDRCAFKGNENLYGIKFSRSLTGTSPKPSMRPRPPSAPPLSRGAQTCGPSRLPAPRLRASRSMPSDIARAWRASRLPIRPR